MASRCLVWSLQHAGTRYALALAEKKIDARAIWAPGYESHDVGDIVKAIWYLENLSLCLSGDTCHELRQAAQPLRGNMSGMY